MMMKTSSTQYVSQMMAALTAGLIALQLDINAGSTGAASTSKSIFLGKWLKLAKKQRRFSRSVSTDIDLLLEYYSQKGRNAKLAEKFQQVYDETRIARTRFNEHYRPENERFMACATILSKQGWLCSIPLLHDICKLGPYTPAQEKELFISSFDFADKFDENGMLFDEISFFVVSEPTQVVNVFWQHGFVLALVAKSKDPKQHYYHYRIFSKNIYDGAIEIPQCLGARLQSK
jgi:hypothetical protein